MVPPLAMALATVVRPKLFTEVERENVARLLAAERAVARATAG